MTYSIFHKLFGPKMPASLRNTRRDDLGKLKMKHSSPEISSPVVFRLSVDAEGFVDAVDELYYG